MESRWEGKRSVDTPGPLDPTLLASCHRAMGCPQFPVADTSYERVSVLRGRSTFQGRSSSIRVIG